MIEGAAILLAGLIGGWIVGRRTRKQTPRELEQKAVCGCEHHYSMHGGDGKCHDGNGRWVNGIHSWVECPCQRYTGPEPLPQVFA